MNIFGSWIILRSSFFPTDIFEILTGIEIETPVQISHPEIPNLSQIKRSELFRLNHWQKRRISNKLFDSWIILRSSFFPTDIFESLTGIEIETLSPGFQPVQCSPASPVQPVQPEQPPRRVLYSATALAFSPHAVLLNGRGKNVDFFDEKSKKINICQIRDKIPPQFVQKRESILLQSDKMMIFFIKNWCPCLRWAVHFFQIEPWFCSFFSDWTVILYIFFRLNRDFGSESSSRGLRKTSS